MVQQMLSDEVQIIPAKQAVWCDPGVRICQLTLLPTPRCPVWIDRGVHIELAVVAPIHVTRRLDATPEPDDLDLAALLAELPERDVPCPFLEEDEDEALDPALDALDLAAPFDPSLRRALPVIPDALSFEERVVQRVQLFARRFGVDGKEHRALLKEILAHGSREHHLSALMEEREELCIDALYAAWELRSHWHEQGPLWQSWLTWRDAILFVTCWHAMRHDLDLDDMLNWLDDAFRDWSREHVYSKWWVFHVYIVEELTALGPDLFAR